MRFVEQHTERGRGYESYGFSWRKSHLYTRLKSALVEAGSATLFSHMSEFDRAIGECMDRVPDLRHRLQNIPETY